MSVSPVSISYPKSGITDGSWMAVIAKALARCMTQLQDRMVKDANEMSKLQTKENNLKDKDTTAHLNKKDQKALNFAKSDLQVATQEYSQVVNALNTVMKTVGQADNVLARKSG